MSQTAKLSIPELGIELDLPVYSGTLGPDTVDVSSLVKAGIFTYDPGFSATAACQSDITYIDGAKGVLLHRGYPIEQLAEKISFTETAYLLLYGELPNKNEKEVFKTAFELDQRWIVELGADRTPYISQAQSINIFLPADVHKKDLHQIHFQAWKKGLKSLYYCRSKSIQRAENINNKLPEDMTETESLIDKDKDNEECLSCQ